MARALGVEFGAIYQATGPDGDVAVFNDPTSPFFAGYLTGDQAVTGLERAEVRESFDLIPEAHGGVHGAFKRGRLPFSLNGIIDASTPDANPAAQDRLLRATDAMEQDSLLEWWPSTIDEGVFVFFREQQPTRITARRPKTFLVTGVCEDPYVYSRLLQQVVINPTTLTTGGVSSPVTSPVHSTEPPAGTGTVVQGGSTRYVWPIYVVTGPCVNPVIANDTLGLELDLLYTLTAGQALRIDTRPRRRRIDLGTPLYDGSANLIGATGLSRRGSALNWQSSTWPYLRSGSNSIRLGFTSFSAGAQLLVEYRDTWG